ncbi:helicase-exonuclease AddAB subunit AddA [Vagococcus fluvialis]|uniref:helicase-exonuclease AddAB subunit AddA n=1 Tax=Vagococcus fluvialis TaxID=2738 RepID=UPI0037AC0D1E
MSKVEIPLRPANSHFTDKQWQAVYDKGDNILISASAGSGKTTVLVERVIQHIKAGTNVDELLIVTYTEAAAKEMKQRIQVAVQSAINEESDLEKRQHLIKQLNLLPTAPISTLHAFCLTVIRKYYYLIHIDPVFRLLTDETEITLLKEDVWEDVREKLYGDKQKEFYELTENFSNDRNDDGLTKLIFSLASFALSNTEPKEWLDKLTKHYEVEGSIINSELYQDFMKPSLVKDLTHLIERSNELINQTIGEPDFEKTLSVFESDKVLLTNILRLVEEDDLDACYTSFLQGKFATIKGPSKKTSPEEVMEVYEELKKERDLIKKQFGTLKKNYFTLSPEKMLELIQLSEPLVREMVFVCQTYLSAFNKQKEEKNLVDFNDLEHMTLAILRELDGGKFKASEASLFYRSKFKEVLVDEYQDVNRLQEGILYWLRRPELNEGNLFMVGDVKQSIYAFRLADPTLFIEKYEQYAEEDDGRRIILAENFRSRGSVLDFTNLIFTQLMDKELGQIEYDQSAELITGFKDYPESSAHDTEILIYESESESEEEEIDLTFEIEDKTEGELLLVGQKIQELIKSKFPIYDKRSKMSRPIKYQDIVLLSPTKKNNLVILDIFKQLDIPLLINDTQNYFQATEVKIMIALLQVIDNPYQDIPFVAVLRSPVVGIKENDLVKIRQYDSNGYFYDALKVYLKQETQVDSLFEKISEFHDQFIVWREMARQEKLVELIWKIYQDTGLLEYVAGMPSGKQRQANLHALYERATSYEEMSFKGLFQFVRFIEKMQAKNKDLAEPNNTTDVEDAVRVMTIHASKGLEFPVVFVLDMNKQFNMTDLNNQSFIFDEKLGAGIKYLDLDKRIKYETLPYVLIKEQKRKKMLAEEMRKLYVALTRAEEKLFLVGSYKSKEVAFKSWQEQINSDHRVLSTSARLGQRSLLGWVGLSIVRHPLIIKEYPELQVQPLKGLETIPVNFNLKFFTKEDIGKIQEEMTPLETRVEKIDTDANPQLLKSVVDILNFSYPNESATKTASYQSVSEIKRLFEDPDEKHLQVIDFSKKLTTKANRIVGEELAKPKFLAEVKEITQAEIGTATHLVMQLIDLEKKPSKNDFEKLINQLVEDGVLEEKLAEKIDITNLLTFFDTELGDLLVSKESVVKREQPFSLLLSAADIYEDYLGKREDRLLIHGIIDGFIETDEELVLYDFKTDYVPKNATNEELEAIKSKYVGQLNLYKQALEQIKERPVTSVKLVLLRGNKQIEML